MFKFLIILLFIHNASSEETIIPKAQKPSIRMSLGYGFALKNNIRQNNNYTGSQADILFSNIPFVQIAWGPFSIGAQGIIASLIGDRDVSGYLNLNRFGDRYYSTGMESRKESWFFGAGFKYYKMNFLLSRDIGGRSHGHRASFSYAVTYPLSEKIMVRSSAGLECYNRSFSEYYYGVRFNEANGDRVEYHPTAFCNPTASFFPSYSFNEDVTLLTGTSLKLLPQTVRVSPLIDKSHFEISLLFGVSWKI